ncbi:MAG: transglycosylase domain-containing protein [Sulfuriferula sp.]
MYRYACFCLIYLFSTAAFAANLPSFKVVRAQHVSSVVNLLDRNGVILNQRIIYPQQQRLPWVALNELSPALLSALLVSEDQRFYQHQGVDWRAIAGAAWENLIHNTHRGASTLTMQLAGLLDPSLTRGVGGRSYNQKWRQIKAAQQLEKHWSKAQILEAYLNLVDFRANIIGINAASNALFDKVPAQINGNEASILSSLLRGPNAKPSAVAQRACGVAYQLTHSTANCTDIQQISLSKLSTQPTLNLYPQLAPAVAQQLLASATSNVLSSLDYALQNSLTQHLANTPLAAAVILDNASAEILAYVSTDDTTNQAITAHDNGAMLQPFIYASAITQKQLTVASILNNTPLVYDITLPDYLATTPTSNWVSVRTALSNALNLPAQQALSQLDRARWNARLQSLQLNPDSNTLLTLANAYQMLANRGIYRPASFHVGGLSTATRIYPSTSSAIINDILATNQTTYYTLISDTSWAIGADARYTLALWVANPEDVRNTWLQIEDDLHLHAPSTPPKLPGKLIKRAIRFEPAIEPARIELFLPGTEQAVFYPPNQTNHELFSSFVSPMSVVIE